MISKLWNWVFRKTAVGKIVDGKKTIIGFSILVLRTLISLASQANIIFPDVQAIVLIAEGLKQVDQAISSLLESLGYGFLAVGVTDKAVKEKQ